MSMTLPNPTDLADAYHRNGYAIVRGLFTLPEISALSDAIDNIYEEALSLGRSFRYGNLHYRLDGDEVRMVQWPSYHNIVLDRVRTNPRIAQLLAPLVGSDVKQIINQLHWKKPGGKGDFAFHQDSRFRKPAWAYRNLGTSYVQTGIAVDPHTQVSGAMRIMPKSHLLGSLDMQLEGPVMENAPEDEVLVAMGLDPADLIHLELEPGDFALWNSYLVHGSGQNVSDHYRRFYINGYVRAADCDRGEWAFRDGREVPLGPRPNLVHFEQLFEKPGPHFV
jgi:ectoine hydroxylase-related dioxygenase (phytanoyl-CoA dioxygenase family)